MNTKTIDRSGTIASPGVSQLIAPANPGRSFLFIENLSTNSLYVDFGKAASDTSIVITQYGALTFDSNSVPTDAIYGFADLGGGAFLCKESYPDPTNYGSYPVPSGTAVLTATNVVGSFVSGSVALNWPASTDPLFSYFKVRRDREVIAKVTGNSYTDTGIVYPAFYNGLSESPFQNNGLFIHGTTYTYTISEVNTGGVETSVTQLGSVTA